MVKVREARPEDGPAIAGLLHHLHSDIPPEAVGERIAALAATGVDPVFVACEDACEAGRVRGVLALHLTYRLHLAGRIARITSLAVAEDARRQGVGRRLIAHATEFAEHERCTMLELTTGLERAEAHAFYRALGFDATSFRFRRPIRSASE